MLFAPSATPAAAAPVRRLFEPTDLEFEEPGVLQLNLQFGPVRGQRATRLSVPDFELDLGLTQAIELDVDGEYALGGSDSGAFALNRQTPDNLWPGLKLGLGTIEDHAHDMAWAAGLQLGPKLPLARNAQGTGFEGIILLGCRWHDSHLILNIGGRRDPAAPGAAHPSGAELGLDLDYPIDRSGQWSVIGQLGAITYTSPDADQLTTAAGVAWQPSPALQLSLIAVYGWLGGGDRYGILLGVAPRFRLW